MTINRDYAIAAAIGGLIGYFVGIRAFWSNGLIPGFVLFGGVAGYAIAENRDLRKKLTASKERQPVEDLAQSVRELSEIVAQMQRNNPSAQKQSEGNNV